MSGTEAAGRGRAKPGSAMSSDIPLAFDSLEARARADAGADPCDRISLRDHVVEVEIGAFQLERGTTQRVRFDVVVEVAPPPRPLLDDVDRILSYDNITDAIAAELAAERLNLLETLAERISARILQEPRARRVYVRIQKLDRGPGALGVEIVRSAPRIPAPLSPAQEAPRPLLLFLSNAAIASARLGGWLDELTAGPRPLVICVGPPARPAPVSAAPAAQRRIDLLAIEQNAWVLAGRDPRCVVVDSRTELDWGLRHGQVSVWAPARMVLDSRERPAADPAVLLGWFAGQIGAAELVSIGAPVPPGLAIPARTVAPGAERLG